MATDAAEAEVEEQVDELDPLEVDALEQDAREQEEHDEPADDEPDPEPEQQPQGHSMEWWQDAHAKADREDERHKKRVAEIYGSESDEFEECPMCLLGPAGWLTIKEFDEEHKAMIRAKLGMEDPSNFEPMPGAALCPTCQGKGKVKTPSNVPGYETLMCPDCRQNDAAGNIIAVGWKYVPGPGAQTPPQFQPVAVASLDLIGGQVNGNTAAVTATEYEPPPYDAWSRPLGHPHYGIPPADVGV